MEVHIISPILTSVFKDIEKVSFPSSSGVLQILKNHAETFFVLKSGSIFLENKILQKEIIAEEGEVYCNNNIIRIIF